MSRKTARELALHMIFEMDFTGEPCGPLLSKRLNPDCFSGFAGDSAIFFTADFDDEAFFSADAVFPD